MKEFTLLSLICLIFMGCENETRAQLDIHLIEYVGGFTKPVDITHAEDERMFIVEQVGRIRIIDGNGSVLPMPFLDIQGRVNSGSTEQGLLGLAFHPDYASNGYFFVNYTGAGDTTHISRFTVTSNPDQADPSGEVKILSVYQPYKNHNGGCVKFGPDGYLYIGLGDGGSGGDPQNYAQDPSQLLGKMLRINVDNNPYIVPATNPFVGMQGVRPEIWAIGLRNPWRFSFDRQTGDLWIGDVGQNSFEEVNMQPVASLGGENYGWRCYEGLTTFNSSGCLGQGNYYFAIHQYDNTGFSGDCSISGGFRYRGSDFSNMQGHYFFADYCSNKLWSLWDSSGTWVSEYYGQQTGGLSSFGENSDGELFVSGLQSGKIYRIVDSSKVSGVQENAESEIRVYPNPTSDLVRIEGLNAVKNTMAYKISDAQGRILKSQSELSTLEEVSFSALEKGIYFLTIYSGIDIMTYRIMKSGLK